jgi:23S rRNA (pseudouridine1915-N3)-methyltransferase
VIYILAPGPLKYPFVKEGLDYYLKGLTKWIKVEAFFPKVKGSFSTREERLKAEEETLLKNLPEKTFLIILDERREGFTTKEFSEFLERLLSREKSITFLIGGPEGISENLKRKAHKSLKISDFTLNHELALLVLSEALYRAISLLKGHPYHRE